MELMMFISKKKRQAVDKRCNNLGYSPTKIPSFTSTEQPTAWHGVTCPPPASPGALVEHLPSPTWGQDPGTLWWRCLHHLLGVPRKVRKRALHALGTAANIAVLTQPPEQTSLESVEQNQLRSLGLTSALGIPVHATGPSAKRDRGCLMPGATCSSWLQRNQPRVWISPAAALAVPCGPYNTHPCGPWRAQAGAGSSWRTAACGCFRLEQGTAWERRGREELPSTDHNPCPCPPVPPEGAKNKRKLHCGETVLTLSERIL